MKNTRLGMTMIEVAIALSLFSVIMVALLEATMSTTTYVEFDSTKTDMETATLQFEKRAGNDLANAAWFYRYDPKGDRSYVDEITGKREVLFPVVSADSKSFEFLRLRSSNQITDEPMQERYANINFLGTNTEPVGFSQYIDSFPTPFMIVNPDYRADPQLFVSPVWESNKKRLSFDENNDPDLIRHFLYVVEPNNSGSRSLVRKYLNGYTGTQPPPEAWKMDESLLDDVTDVKFSTYLQDTNLHQCQVRISVQMERLPQGATDGSAAKVKRRIDFTASMRSINQEN
jgi:prepilin-type N-terminal cleavage/methylation domain-containing protein